MTVFSNISREVRFLAKQRYILALLGIVFSLSVFAVWSGISETRFQLNTIDRLQEKDDIDRKSVLAKQKDYGSVCEAFDIGIHSTILVAVYSSATSSRSIFVAISVLRNI